MTAKRKKILIFSISARALTALATVVRVLALLKEFDLSVGYYARGAILPTVFNIIATLFVVASIVAIPTVFKSGDVAIAGQSRSCRFSSLLAVAGFALLAWERWSDFMLVSDVYTGAKLIFALLSPILMLSLLTFFVACCFGLEPSPLVAISGSLSIITLAVELAKVYNTFEIAINSPNKTLFQLTIISAMLYILAELRTVFSASRPRFYLFSLTTAIFFLGASSLPSIIASAAGTYENKLIKEDVAFLGIFVFCVFRLIGIIFSKDEPECELCEEYEDGYEIVEETEGSEEPDDSEEPEVSEEPEESPQDQPPSI